MPFVAEPTETGHFGPAAAERHELGTGETRQSSDTVRDVVRSTENRTLQGRLLLRPGGNLETHSVKHDVRDGDAAAARARGGYSTAWHPLLAAREVEPGLWYMVAQYERCYAIIRMLVIGGETGYRAVTWEADPTERQLVGYFRSLRAATEAAHGSYIRNHVPPTRDPRRERSVGTRGIS